MVVPPLEKTWLPIKVIEVIPERSSVAPCATLMFVATMDALPLNDSVPPLTVTLLALVIGDETASVPPLTVVLPV